MIRARWRRIGKNMFSLAIIGRPNVGKSTLFNRLAGKKLALVSDAAGVTRDWRDVVTAFYDLPLRVIDTAGVEEGDQESLKGRMTQTTLNALTEADAVLFMVDARAGLTAADRDVARMLRKSGKPVILVANKCDFDLPAAYDELHALGFGEPIAFSAEHAIGMNDLYGAIKKTVGSEVSEVRKEEAGEEDERDKPLHLAVIGRPNAGKSTLVNALIGKPRMLTGPEAGLTRDAVHIPFEYKGRAIRLVDTPGLRRNAKVHEALEKMSVAETQRAVRLAHIVILVVDANEMFENQDLHLAQMVEREGRGLVIAINKWDTITNKEEVTAIVRRFLDNNIAQLPDIPIVMTSAMKGQKLDKLMDTVFAMYDMWNRRISTSELNRWLEPILEHHPAPLVKGRRIKIRYMTQIKTRPPTFVLWGNNTGAVPDTYLRYISNDLRRRFDLPGVPLRFDLRKGDNPFADKKEK